MALSKAEVCRAFREVMAADYADVPAKEEIDHVFSPEFYAKMAALIAEQKRGSWRLLSRKSRRALVVAAILAVSMLLVACTPKLRNAVSELIVTIYERFVDYGTNNIEGHEEIETIYALEPIPEGFTFVSQTQRSPFYAETTYQDDQGKLLVLKQWAAVSFVGTSDNENGKTMLLTKGEENVCVLIYSAETFTTATWSYDGYIFKLSYYVEPNTFNIENLLSAVSPAT